MFHEQKQHSLLYVVTTSSIVAFAMIFEVGVTGLLCGEVATVAGLSALKKFGAELSPALTARAALGGAA